MTESAGLTGPWQAAFEDGLRLLAAALAIRAGHPAAAAAVSSACGALRCFLKVLEAAAARGVPDPDGHLDRLKAQCQALLTLRQDPGDALAHVLEAARLARDAAARALVMLPQGHPDG